MAFRRLTRLLFFSKQSTDTELSFRERATRRENSLGLSRTPKIPRKVVSPGAIGRSHDWATATLASLSMPSSKRSTGGRGDHRRAGKRRADQPETSPLSDAALAAEQERVVYIDTELDRNTVCSVINGLGDAFYHIPFAVCGVAAMVYYGYDKFTLNRISILCPAESAEVILCWARSRDMPLFAKDPTMFGYRMADGRVCFVRVRTQDSASFGELGFVHLGPFKTPVLTLPCLVNQFAKDYIGKLEEIAPEMQRRYAKDIMWMLDEMAHLDEPCQSFTPKHVCWVLSRGFWLPFTLSFPEAIDLFSAAGLFNCFTECETPTDSADTDSFSSCAAVASPILQGQFEQMEISSSSSQQSVSGSNSPCASSPRTSFSTPTVKYRKGEPDLNKPLPRLPDEAYQPPLICGRTYAKGFPDLGKALPPLPSEAFDTEPPIHSCKSFAARMLARCKRLLMPSSPSRPPGVFAQVRTPEPKMPPKLRRVMQNLPDRRNKQVRFDGSADGYGSSCRSTSRSTERYYGP